MEESKVKTVEEIAIEAKRYADEVAYLRSFEESFVQGAKWAYSDLQSHITKLEARNKELEEALEEIAKYKVYTGRRFEFDQLIDVAIDILKK